VTNTKGALLSGDYGVDMARGPGIVINSGIISGRTDAVLFGQNGLNRLVVNPTAAFTGLVDGNSSTSTLELAGGSGSISNLSGGSGTISQNGNWSFANFQTLSVDAGGTWTLNGGNVATIANNGTINVKASLDVSSAIDPGSSGVFQLTGGAALEVASAIGSNARIAFLTPSRLTIDNPLSFGSGIGSSSYAGPQLQGFAKGDTIDLRQFSPAGAIGIYNSSSGLLQISNSGHQLASLEFSASTLGAGTFHFASDGGGGTLVTLG
jgi:hypothetical protein